MPNPQKATAYAVAFAQWPVTGLPLIALGLFGFGTLLAPAGAASRGLLLSAAGTHRIGSSCREPVHRWLPMNKQSSCRFCLL